MSNALPLAARVALVAGAAGPFGRAIAIALAEAGADLTLTTSTVSEGEEFAINSIANELWALGRRYLTLTIDLADREAVPEALGRALADLGRLDYLVCDAGHARTLLAGAGTLGADEAPVFVLLQSDESGRADSTGDEQGLAVCRVIVDAGASPAAVAAEVLNLLREAGRTAGA